MCTNVSFYTSSIIAVWNEQGSQHDLVPALAEEVQGVYKVWHRRQGNI